MDCARQPMDRREFLKDTATGVIGTAACVGAMNGALAAEEAASKEKEAIWRNKQPGMEYRRLGRTNFMTSRVVAGWCKGDDRLREGILSKGVNYLDTARGYGEYEVELSGLLKKHRDNVWVTSKATDIAGFTRMDAKLQTLYDEAVAAAKEPGKKLDLRPAGKHAAALYEQKLNESLGRMKIDFVDCYMVHGIKVEWFFDLTEVWETFEKAQKAGKIGCFGFSTHDNVENVLKRAVIADKDGPWKIDLIMPAVNPANYPTLVPVLKDLKARDIGIIAMKTTGQIRRPTEAIEQKFEDKSKAAQWNDKERAYTYMLHCTDTIDAVISTMNSFNHLERNVTLPAVKLAVAERRRLEAQVVLEQRGVCHHCGDCTASCPESIEVFNILRYQAYHYNYDEKDLARSLYRQLGMDPSKVCTNCGKCAEVCPEGIALNEVIAEAAKTLA